MESFLKNVQQLKACYQTIKSALPWLDVSVWEHEPTPFGNYGREPATPYVRSAELDLSLKGEIAALKRENIHILRYNPENGPMNSFSEIFSEMTGINVLLAILHTDISIEEIIKFALKNPDLKIIIESGPRKILYFLEPVKNALRQCNNIFLCTYNFCNWYGHEELCGMGYGNRLLYGSHMRCYSEDASMGPVILSQLDWETKCDIAGNNLRRLLGVRPLKTQEIKYLPASQFIVDSHAHNLQPGNSGIYKMPTPDLEFSPADWLDFLDLCSVERLYLIPGEVLYDNSICCRDYVHDLVRYDPDRFFYFEVFNPLGDENHVERLKGSCGDPQCIGIKIHPTFHRTDADDERFAPVYRLAEEYEKPIMTHSWEYSSYNPEQNRSHPDKFRKFLKEFRRLPFILGHAGGRPSAFEATIELCNEFPNVYVDLAGDYFNNGLIDILASRIGAERVLFASDVDWIDTRCTLAPVLGSNLPDEDVLKILRLNAIRLFHGT